MVPSVALHPLTLLYFSSEHEALPNSLLWTHLLFSPPLKCKRHMGRNYICVPSFLNSRPSNMWHEMNESTSGENKWSPDKWEHNKAICFQILPLQRVRRHPRCLAETLRQTEEQESFPGENQGKIQVCSACRPWARSSSSRPAEEDGIPWHCLGVHIWLSLGSPKL